LYALHHDAKKPTKALNWESPIVKQLHIQNVHLKHVPPDKLLSEGLAERRRAALNNNTCRLERGDLAVRTTLAAGNDGTGVAHTPTGRSRDTGDERDNGLLLQLVGLTEEVRGILLGGTTDLTNHDDTVGLGVLEEDLEAVDEVGAAEGVTADTDDERLTETGLGGLVDGLVGEGTGTGDDTDATALVDETGHDTDLALTL
jgi:hypothetical protein